MENNLAIVRQSYANTVFTHKVQEVAAENMEKASFRMKLTNIALVFVVLVMLTLQLKFTSSSIFSYIGAGVAIGEILFLIVQLTFDFEQQMILHKNSALKYMGLRDKYRSLIADIMDDKLAQKEIIYRRDLLQAEYQVISDLAPQTSSEEYTEAQKRLNIRGAVESEQFTWSDKEINHFLPENLRIGEEL